MPLDWVLQLAASGGAALAAAAGTDAWGYARTEFSRLLGRGDPDSVARIGHRLDRSAAAIEQAPAESGPEVRAHEQAAWQTRLTDLVEDDPAIADELTSLVTRLHEILPATENHWVQTITASSPGATAQGVQGGDIHNH